MNNRSDKSHQNEDNHLNDDSQEPKKSDTLTRLLTSTKNTSEDGNGTLIVTKRSLLSTQVLIDWGEFHLEPRS